MPGRGPTKHALSKLKEVRDMIREAEVELRESAYYPHAESRRHLSEAASDLVAAEQALRTVLGILEAPGETLSEPQPRTEKKEEQMEHIQKEDKIIIFPTKILLATDGSRDAELASKAAIELAQKTNSELHAVYVRPRIVPHRPGYYVGPEVAEDAERKEREELERKARRLLDAQAEEVRGAGGDLARAHIRVGRPDEEIVGLAEEIGAGLIVMGSRGLGGVRRALMGSVSYSVVRHAHCPVLVVRREESREKEEPDRGMRLT